MMAKINQKNIDKTRKMISTENNLILVTFETC